MLDCEERQSRRCSLHVGYQGWEGYSGIDQEPEASWEVVTLRGFRHFVLDNRVFNR